MGSVPDDVAILNARLGKPGAIEFSMSELGGIVARLSSAAGTALVALKGGQVLSWMPAGEREVLWLSPMARLDGPKAVRGGVPVCWPWFGPHPADAHLPAHGFARTSEWRCVASQAKDDAVFVTLECEPGATARSLWPHSARLSLGVTLADTLRLDLTTTNTGSDPLAISEALHTYLGVGDISRTGVEGLDGARYIDSVDASTIKKQSGPITFDRETDRIYVGTHAQVSIRDPIFARRITITKEGSASTVVWNPWIDKAARLGDVGADGYRDFVCVETANAGPDLVTIAPGASHRLTTILAVEP